jgi:hypothetical protein
MDRISGMRKAGKAARVWSRKPRPPLFRGKWAIRDASSGGSAEVFVIRWSRSVVVELRAFVSGDAQDWIVGGEVVSVCKRTSAARRCVIEAKVQNLYRVAMA